MFIKVPSIHFNSYFHLVNHKSKFKGPIIISQLGEGDIHAGANILDAS